MNIITYILNALFGYSEARSPRKRETPVTPPVAIDPEASTVPPLPKGASGSTSTTAAKKAGTAGTIAAAIALAVTTAAPLEGYVGYVYKDAVGVLTYCYGETLNAKDMKGIKFTEAECKKLLTKRMEHYDQGLQACIPKWASLPVETRAAFDSFAYNVGITGACSSSASSFLRQGNITKACNALLLWDKGTVNKKKVVLKGLTKRRNIERTLCIRGVKA